MNAPVEPDIERQVVATLRSILNLDAGQPLDAGSALLGNIAELDSMAVVSIINALEERFGFVVDDDEVDGRTFATVGSLAGFVQGKLTQ